MRNKLIETLQIEEDSLLKKIEDARLKDDFNKYKMLIGNLTQVVHLKNEEIVRSKYKVGNLYFDIGKDYCILCFNDNMYGLKGFNIKNIVNKIKEITYGDEKINVYGDIRGIGLELADSLKSEGYIIKPTTINICDFNKNIFRELKQDYNNR